MVARRSFLALAGAGVISSLASREHVLASLMRPSEGASFSDVPYAGLAHYQFDPGRADEVVQSWETGILTAARQWPGFIQGMLLLDRMAGKAIAFGVFASKGDADAFGATEAFRRADARLASVLLAPPVREEYEVYSG
jgi:hypothetical protein